MKVLYACLLALALTAVGVPGHAQQQPGLRVLIPSDDTCNAFVAALNNGDRTMMLDLGGWALGYLSGVAQQSGKNILGALTSENVMDRIGDRCQRDPNRAMSAVVMEIARTLLAQAP